MDIRVGCTVVAWIMDSLYKQLVKYCCGSLLSSLVNTQLVFSTRYPPFEIYCLCCYWTLVQWLPQHIHLKEIVLLGFELPTTWKLDIMLEINQSLNQLHVVATTRPVSNSSTTSKSQRADIQWGTRVVYSQENSTGNHNSILPTIYINYP